VLDVELVSPLVPVAAPLLMEPLLVVPERVAGAVAEVSAPY